MTGKAKEGARHAPQLWMVAGSEADAHIRETSRAIMATTAARACVSRRNGVGLEMVRVSIIAAHSSTSGLFVNDRT